MAGVLETAIRSSVLWGVTKVARFNRSRLPMPDVPHPFLSGIHAPMTDERTLTNLVVIGTIPPALDGRYLRIGPNPVRPNPAAHHWFTGDGMVHGIAIKDGRALWYRNRWIRSKAVGAALGRPPAPGPRHGLNDTVNTNVVGIAGRTWALVEAGSTPVELSDDLDEQAYNSFDNTLAGSFTAHPHRDPLTGEHHAVAYEATNQDTVRHVVLSPDGRVVREAVIGVRHGPSVHDCAITARYAIILDLPVTFSMRTLIDGHPFPYTWNPAHQARVGLLPRHGADADIIWCNVDPCYVFHIANAYDTEDGRVILDVIAYATMFAESLKGPDGTSRGLERWTLDPVSRSVHRRTVDASPQEFPRIDERRFGLPYRYAYATALPKDRDAQTVSDTRLFKHDLHDGTRTVHEFGAGRIPGEFVFVPAYADADEDEGWLIGLVIDRGTDTTDLVIIDARDFAGEPPARIRIPHRVPPGFHGNWLQTSLGAEQLVPA